MQVFGAQRHRQPGVPWTQEPFNHGLVSAAVRKLFNVSELDEQQTRLEKLKAAAQQ